MRIPLVTGAATGGCSQFTGDKLATVSFPDGRRLKDGQEVQVTTQCGRQLTARLKGLSPDVLAVLRKIKPDFSELPSFRLVITKINGTKVKITTTVPATLTGKRQVTIHFPASKLAKNSIHRAAS
jgi:hypothetical protein